MTATPWGAVVEFAADRHGVFTRAEAARLGTLDHHLASMLGRGVIERVVPGVYRVVGAPRTWRQRLMARCVSSGGVAAMLSAAFLHRLDGSVERAPEVLVGRASRGRVRHGHVHSTDRLEPCDVTEVDGIPVTSVARTLCDVGAVVSDDLVERFLDDALRRGFPLTWIEETLERVHRPGPSGTHSLLRVLSRSDRKGVVPDSWKERCLERMLDHEELQPLVRQHEIRDRDGKFVARLDLAIPDARVGIEFHSDAWHHGPRRGRRDRRRDLAASQAGWELVYLDESDFALPGDAVEALLDIVRRRRAEIAALAQVVGLRGEDGRPLAEPGERS
jgi:hypothetical protein